MPKIKMIPEGIFSIPYTKVGNTNLISNWIINYYGCKLTVVDL